MLLKDHSFKDLTSMNIGGKIQYFYLPNSVNELQKFIRDNNYKYEIIGNGTNIIPSDSDFEGYIISLKNIKEKIVIENDKLIIPAGKKLISAANKYCKLGYDLSYLGTIPGTFGGAVYMNSGAYNEEISNHFISGDFINEIGDIVTLNNNEMNFSYRQSIMQNEKLILIRATFKFPKEDKSSCKLHHYRQIRRHNQPIDKFNCGSVFKNLPNIQAWKLISLCGLKGFSINDAQISTKHSNFIINNGNATADDIYNLFTKIKEEVFLKFGIKLKSEWQFINW